VRRVEEFEQLQPLQFAIAYRILGSVSEAEDAIQEAAAGRPRRGPRSVIIAPWTRAA
jgi:hypothetical protein